MITDETSIANRSSIRMYPSYSDGRVNMVRKILMPAKTSRAKISPGTGDFC